MDLQQRDRIAFRFLDEGKNADVSLDYKSLNLAAARMAAVLRQSTVAGDRVLLMLPPSMDYIVSFLACMRAGVIAVPAYPPVNRRTRPRLQAILEDCRPAACVAQADMRGRYASALGSIAEEIAWIDIDVVGGSDDVAIDEPFSPPADSPAVLQYTSGSTSTPKGVIVSHGNLMANCAAAIDRYSMSESDVVVSWLPPFHDMGLVGAIAYPIYAGASCVQFSPSSFMQRPDRWLEALSEYRGTLTVAPNFAYQLMAERARESVPDSVRLDSVRIAVNGAERIRPETLRRFAAAYADQGFKAEALTPAYGLAEATLLVAARVSKPGDGLQTLALDRVAIAEGRVLEGGDNPIEIASVGSPVAADICIVAANESGQVGPGQIGEILVSGPSVTLGYWAHDSLTRESYIMLDGRRWLRTGDLGFLYGGELYVTGRLKELIVLGGRNLYPQDVEQTVVSVDRAFSQDGCAVFSCDEADSSALAIVLEIPGAALADVDTLVARIRVAVADAHDIYDLASITLIRSGHLPRTSSGKIQRRRCRELLSSGAFAALWQWRSDEADSVALVGSDAEDDDNAVRLEIAVLVSEVLGIDPPDHDQDLFRLGCDSVRLAMLKARLESAYGVECASAELFASATVAGLARIVLSANRREADCLYSEDRTQPLPLSWSQQRLWFLDRLDASASAAYHIAAGVRLRGQLEEAVLQRTLDRIVERHEALRTRFEETSAGPVQVVLEPSPIALMRQDLSGVAASERDAALEATCAQFASSAFDLAAQPPVRALLVRLVADEHVLVLVQHHIVSDGWSLGVLVRELGALYAAYVQGQPDPLPTLPVQYADYAAWQRSRLSEETADAQIAAWCSHLRDAPALLDLPTDRPRHAIQSYRGGRFPVQWDGELVARLRALAQTHGVTLYMTLLAGWSALLSRLSGQGDVVIGTPVANRPRVELEGLIGFFVNTLALRMRTPDEMTVSSLLAQAKAVVLENYERQEVPFERVVEALHPARSLSHSPVFQSLLSLDNTPERPLVLPDLDVESYVVAHGATQFDLTLTLRE
ncbi:condensation domain-containing protein, partial [Dyella sp. AD56]|uniref:condensation domain-containing protein n=1 Tax=Dyella sp. AD56 TaxID=1528744 RepID=UPI0011AF86C2